MSEKDATARDSDSAGTASLDAIHAQLRELIHHMRCAKAPDDVLAMVHDNIQVAREALEPHVIKKPGWSTVSVGGEPAGAPWLDDDITSIMPYSPVTGEHNAVAPDIKMWREGDEIHGEAFFTPTYAGPPDCVHGGIIAAVFDELLSMANVITGDAGFTGTLSIRYHATTPISTPIELFAQNVRREGRKLICKGEMRVDGKVTASAEGLFIAAAETLGDVPKS